MYSKRIAAVILLLIVFMAPLSILIKYVQQPSAMKADFKNEGFVGALEKVLSDNFPLRQALGKQQYQIRYLAGQREFDSIFVSNERFIENIAAPNETYVENNLDAIRRFAERTSVPITVALIPTQCAIKQEELPARAPLYNQLLFIERFYQALDDKTTTVDVYSRLFANRAQDLYYRTHPNLTGLGGFYIYQALFERMSLRLKNLDLYNVRYVGHEFYGATYQKFPYAEVKSDAIPLYYTQKEDVQYTVEHFDVSGSRTQEGLYDLTCLANEDRTDAILGGLSPITRITNPAGNVGTILLFGDETVKSYIPFVAEGCPEVTVVNLERTSLSLLEQLNPMAYDQILFCYSVDSVMHQDYLEKVNHIAYQKKNPG